MSLKRRRQIRCSLCTPDRWKGNAANRFKAKEHSRREQMKREAEQVKRKGTS